MKTLNFTLKLLFIFIMMNSLNIAQDWANLNHFKEENAKLDAPSPDEDRVVFMGNSITQGWSELDPDFFFGKPYIERGISGQTTPQMLVRFRADVINLRPKVVVILAGTNDIAENTGPSTLEMIADNIFSMAELAIANYIKVVLASVLPAYDYTWHPGLHPDVKIPELNKLIKEYADLNNIIYLDFFSAMVDDRNGMLSALTYDGVHPSLAGYKIMEPLVEEAITNALMKDK